MSRSRWTTAASAGASAGGAVSSGNAGLDAMVRGGLERGTSALLLGAAGVGKSSLALAYAVAAAGRGERVVIYTFDEGRGTMVARAASLGLPLQAALDTGLVSVRQVDPAELSPGEFASLVRAAVEVDGARMVVIDSLNGYLNAMPDERFLVLQMHELLSYLNQAGVLSILVLGQHGLLGQMKSPIDVSYLSDTVLVLRYFEFESAVLRAISVVKKRTSEHERTIREFRLGPQGLVIGPPLKGFRGVFTGTPEYTGAGSPLMAGDEPDGGR